MHFTRGGMVGKYDHIYIYTYIYIYIERERERERERDGTWEASMHAYMPCQTLTSIVKLMTIFFYP